MSNSHALVLFCRILWLAVACGCARQTAPPPNLARPQPNILFIMADDHASAAVSAYGGMLAGIAPTPHIDRIGAEGMRLNNVFCTNSICTPSRACILTGQYSQLNGVYTLSDPIDPAHENVAKLLRAAGYQTGIVGKWHLQSEPAGFDYWRILVGQGTYFDPVFIEPGGRQKHAGYSEDIITDLSLDWIKNRDPAKPFFLMCHYKSPHRPWEPPARYEHMFEGVKFPEPANLLDDYKTRSSASVNAKQKVGENMSKTDLKVEKPAGLDRDALRRWAYPIFLRDYLRCVAAVDENVGRILDFLDKSGLAENTVVIYTSDQGAFIGEHGFYDKRFMYDESIRMPFLVRYPREIKRGTVNEDLVINADFAPTFLDFAGLPAPSEMQGRSFRGVLEGRTPADWRGSMYYRYWLHNSKEHGIPAHYGIRTKDYKLIFFYGLGLGKRGSAEEPTPPEWELYDLGKDPREMNNVYGDPGYSGVRERLKAHLLELKKQYRDEDEAYPQLMAVREKAWR